MQMHPLSKNPARSGVIVYLIYIYLKHLAAPIAIGLKRALIIAALGHLKGLSATTYPTVFELLRGYGVEVFEDRHLGSMVILPQQLT